MSLTNSANNSSINRVKQHVLHTAFVFAPPLFDDNPQPSSDSQQWQTRTQRRSHEARYLRRNSSCTCRKRQQAAIEKTIERRRKRWCCYLFCRRIWIWDLNQAPTCDRILFFPLTFDIWATFFNVFHCSTNTKAFHKIVRHANAVVGLPLISQAQVELQTQVSVLIQDAGISSWVSTACFHIIKAILFTNLTQYSCELQAFPLNSVKRISCSSR